LNCCRDLNTSQAQSQILSQNLSQSSNSSQCISYIDFSNPSQVRPIAEFINLVNVCFFYAQTCFEFFYAQIKNTYCIILYFMCIICVRIHTASLFGKQVNSILTSLDCIMRVAPNVRRHQCQMVLAIDAHAGVMLNFYLFQQC
jgi:hypothetical protein